MKKLISSYKGWLGVFGLSISVFIFNTTEFAPIALLSDIGSDLSISESRAGLIITIYAWCVAFLSLPLMLLCANIERKKLLSIVFSIFIFGHIVLYFTSSFSMLIVARIFIAFAHSIFWSITASLAYRLAPNGKGARALSILATGSALAMIMGIPLGRIFGQVYGWREMFLVIGFLALCLMFFLIKILPNLPSLHSGNIKSLPLIFKRPLLIGVFVITALFVTGQTTVYSYIEPYLLQVAQFENNFATMMLSIYGISGILGSIIFAKYSNKIPNAIFNIPMLIISFCFLVFLIACSSEINFLLLCIIWGISSMCINLALQTKVLKLAPDATDIAMSMYSGIYNIGIGGGAFFGGIIINVFGLKYISFFAAIICFFVFLLSLFLHVRLEKK